MKSDYLNLVFTRSCDGDHASLQRWYNDHIAILWDCEALQRATLWRRESGRGNEADYVCAYAFADEAAFLTYEHGPAREAARQVLLDGWGRDGIAITERRQFRRQWTQRRQPGDALDALHTFWLLRLPTPATPADKAAQARWMADQVHHLLGSGNAHAATQMRAVSAEAGTTEVLLGLQSLGPLPDQPHWREGAWGQPPQAVSVPWRWSGRVVAEWSR